MNRVAGWRAKFYRDPGASPPRQNHRRIQAVARTSVDAGLAAAKPSRGVGAKGEFRFIEQAQFPQVAVRLAEVVTEGLFPLDALLAIAIGLVGPARECRVQVRQ